MKRLLKVIGIIIGIGLLYGVLWNLAIYISARNKSFAELLVATHFTLFSCHVNETGCNERRPLPEVLQGKKIVFNKTTTIEFDPFERREDFSDVDILGFLDTNSHEFKNTFTDPVTRERGTLEEREYDIVRAVYHRNCSYCIYSIDYAYIVFEDSKVNRFSLFLNDMDSSVVPGRDIPWDRQLPFELGRDGERGKLVDIPVIATSR